MVSFFFSIWLQDVILSSAHCLSFCLNRKKIQLSFSRFMAEPTRSIWILLWLWLQRAPSTCEDTHTHTPNTRHHIRCTVCVGSHWSDWTSLLFCEKDAVAGRCQQHDWQVWCEGSPGLHPHLHTSTAQHIVSPKMKGHSAYYEYFMMFNFFSLWLYNSGALWQHWCFLLLLYILVFEAFYWVRAKVMKTTKHDTLTLSFVLKVLLSFKQRDLES